MSVITAGMGPGCTLLTGGLGTIGGAPVPSGGGMRGGGRHWKIHYIEDSEKAQKPLKLEILETRPRYGDIIDLRILTIRSLLDKLDAKKVKLEDTITQLKEVKGEVREYYNFKQRELVGIEHEIARKKLELAVINKQLEVMTDQKIIGALPKAPMPALKGSPTRMAPVDLRIPFERLEAVLGQYPLAKVAAVIGISVIGLIILMRK